MTTGTRRMMDLQISDHTLTVPLNWNDRRDARTLDVHAAIVTRDGGENLPYLLFLQGGPGFEAPRPFHSPSEPAWLDAALARYRVVLLDQRGTGSSSPVDESVLGGGADAAAEYLTHFRADAIVRDAEALREELGAASWSVLGQSFGGFTTLSYISTAPSSLDAVYFTGGLSAIGHSPDEVYRRTYAKTRVMVERYYRRFPEHRETVRVLVDNAEAGLIVLPDGERVSPSRIRSLGMLLGSDNGWQTLWTLLEEDPGSLAFRYDLAHALPFSPRNPLYYVLHESCYADGSVTAWAADRTEPDDFREDSTLLTAEHVRRDWSRTVPGLAPWRETADLLADVSWPHLYDPDAIAASEVRGAAAVYVNDIYVPFETSIATASLLPHVATLVTSEHEHSGLRSGAILPRLFELADGAAMR